MYFDEHKFKSFFKKDFVEQWEIQNPDFKIEIRISQSKAPLKLCSLRRVNKLRAVDLISRAHVHRPSIAIFIITAAVTLELKKRAKQTKCVYIARTAVT